MRGGSRLDFIDIAKGIGIFLVVWAHASGLLTDYIIQFHMPFFFLISGYLYNSDRDLKTYTLRKIRSLYIPFVFWNLLAGMLRFLLGKSGFPLVYSIEVLLTLTKDGQFFGATWFLGALFAVSLAYRYLDEAVRNMKDRHLLLMLIFGLVGFSAKEITLPFSLSRTLILAMFFALGVCIRDCFQSQSIRYRGGWLFAVSLALFAVFGHYSTAKMGTNDYPYFAAFILTSLTGSSVVIGASWFINAHMRIVKRFLSWLGRESIHIVIWHLALFRIVILAQIMLGGGSVTELLDYYPIYSSEGLWPVAYTVVGVFGSLALGKMIMKFDSLAESMLKRKVGR